MVNLPTTISADSITIKPTYEGNIQLIHCDKIKLNHDFEIYSKSANTFRSWGGWNMKAAKDVEFWSSVNQITRDSIIDK
jgi:hypothetical protein